MPVYYVLAPAEASTNLSRYDGVRYGHRATEYSDLIDMYCSTRAEGFGDEVKRRILVGTYVLSHGYYDAYYMQAQQIRRLIARDFAEAFSVRPHRGADAPTTAFELGEKTDDPVQMYLGDIFTIPRQSRGPARHVDPVRLRREGPAGGAADHGQALRGSAAAQCRAPVPAGDRLASPMRAGIGRLAADERGWEIVIGTRDPRPARSRKSRRCSPAPSTDVRRPAQHPGLARWTSRCPACCRC